jgi:hypothetical protein
MARDSELSDSARLGLAGGVPAVTFTVTVDTPGHRPGHTLAVSDSLTLTRRLTQTDSEPGAA